MDYTAIIQDSMDYIEDNLRTELTAAELAQRAGFSLFHYYRLFSSATGLSVKHYILRRRLLHAIYAVSRGESGIQAALTYGFDTYAGFYRAFVREFSCTPAVFLTASRARRPYRLDLKKEEHMTITRKKAAEILKHWDLNDLPVTDIYNDSTGEHNYTAYNVGKHHVLKFSANLGRLKNHMTLSKAIAAAGLAAPVPVPTADGRDFVCDGEVYFCLTTRLPGAQMTAKDFYGADPVSKARFLGQIIGQLHQALQTIDCCVSDADLPETLREWAFIRAEPIIGSDPGFWNSFLAAFKELHSTLPRQIIHRDPQPGNIILSDGKWGFIDFELSERNIRIYDPCYAATAVLSESFGRDMTQWLEVYRNILNGYDSVIHLTAAERTAIPYVILANQFICVAWFADHEKYADLLEINKNMTRWLIAHFEELKI